MRLEKAIGSKGKEPCKHTTSETQTHSQKFQKSGWNGLEIATNDRIFQEKSGQGRKCILMTEHFFEWLERVYNSQKGMEIVGNKSAACCSDCSQLVPSNFIGYLRLFVRNCAVWLLVNMLRKFGCCVTALPVCQTGMGPAAGLR